MGLGMKVYLLKLLHAEKGYWGLRVEDFDMGLWHLFADSFSCLLMYMSTASYNYFDAHKNIDGHERQC